MLYMNNIIHNIEWKAYAYEKCLNITLATNDTFQVCEARNSNFKDENTLSWRMQDENTLS